MTVDEYDSEECIWQPLREDAAILSSDLMWRQPAWTDVGLHSVTVRPVSSQPLDFQMRISK